MKKKNYMSEEFYELLANVIKECEQHPYSTSRAYNCGEGWELRVSKKNLGTWENEQKEAIDREIDAKINELCDASQLDCWVHCDCGGYMYLVYK